MILLLMVLVTPLFASAAGAQLICADHPSLKQKRLCFDLDGGRFVDPQVGRSAVYDVESALKQREISLGGHRRKESVFCPAVEACSCPWKAGFGLWESCRDRISSLCNGEFICINFFYCSDRVTDIEDCVFYGSVDHNRVEHDNGKEETETKEKEELVSDILTGNIIPRKKTNKAKESVKPWESLRKNQRVRVVDWRVFDTIIFIQIALGLVHIIAGISAGAVGQLSVWPFFLTALLLFITVVPTVHEMIAEDERGELPANFNAMVQLDIVCGTCCLFFVALNLLDFACGNLVWSAYFVLSVVFWQSDIAAIVVEHGSKQKDEPSVSYTEKLASFLEKELAKRRERRKRRIDRLAKQM
ncbi:unnamed protein product [Toxocara canis]|uniref:Transmembrane protein n=1 Tax=Toxocara canis TaxID=6265 RepID=A0A183UFR7_TOXCA|nr:unnamed protein product [Toxocara canis]